MNILVINCHWDNRGDEAAIRAMIDEIIDRFPDARITVQRAVGRFDSFPYSGTVGVLSAFPVGGRKRALAEKIAILSNGIICLTKGSREFYKTLKQTDLVIHAPGGPSIGDIYLQQESKKLLRLDAIRRSGVPYVFYAPSMGPFRNKKRNPMRKRVLQSAAMIALREEISLNYVKEFDPTLKPIVTLDSAFQHSIDFDYYERELMQDESLNSFLNNNKKIIGVTITDLQWNKLYKGNEELKENIKDTFIRFVDKKTQEGYKILFIPQLFGRDNDFEYMTLFANDSCLVMSIDHDCYFQQYVISKLFAVVGMRYHSNIFSAKMETPFVSVSYEQKMKGFMKKIGLEKYCIDISELSYNNLNRKFDEMVSSYNEYKKYLIANHMKWVKMSQKTTELVAKIIDDRVKG